MKRAAWLPLLLVACTGRNPAFRDDEVKPLSDAEAPALPADAAPPLSPDLAPPPSPDTGAPPPPDTAVPDAPPLEPDAAPLPPDAAAPDLAPPPDLAADVAPLTPDLAPPQPDLAPDVASMSGLTGFYYKDTTLTTLAFQRVDPYIDFTWGNETPDPATIPVAFSVRWTGKVHALYSETYTFSVHSGDGCRLWIDNIQVMNNWKSQAPMEIAATPVALIAGWHTIKLEYLHNTGWSSVRIIWESLSQKRGLPATQYWAPN